jgi:hypothetical protein
MGTSKMLSSLDQHPRRVNGDQGNRVMRKFQWMKVLPGPLVEAVDLDMCIITITSKGFILF